MLLLATGICAYVALSAEMPIEPSQMSVVEIGDVIPPHDAPVYAEPLPADNIDRRGAKPPEIMDDFHKTTDIGDAILYQSNLTVSPRKVAYLTFDDGPSRSVTPAILDILAEEGVPATFFVVARPNGNLDDIYRRILDEGHEIGNHTYSHNSAILYGRDTSAFENDVVAAGEFIENLLGYKMTSFRFPGGSMGRSPDGINARRELVEELGYRWFDWNISSGDAHPDPHIRTPAEVTRLVLNDTRNREHIVILFHDSGNRTSLAALPDIIAGLRDKGYAFDIMRNHP